MNLRMLLIVTSATAIGSVLAVFGTAAWADNGKGKSQACRSTLVGTYLTTVEDSDGAFASRSLITFHDDGTMTVVDARQLNGVTGTAFSAQQGAYRCTGRHGAVATGIDFGFPPDENIGRLDWRIDIAHDGTVEGDLTLNVFTPQATCNPFDEATCELEVQVDFSFSSVRVPSEVD